MYLHLCPSPDEIDLAACVSEEDDIDDSFLGVQFMLGLEFGSGLSQVYQRKFVQHVTGSLIKIMI